MHLFYQLLVRSRDLSRHFYLYRVKSLQIANASIEMNNILIQLATNQDATLV